MLDKAYNRPTARSRELRRNLTEAERVLWRELSGRNISGVPFNRQFPVGQFICDFVCREQRLVIEVDGGQHAVDAEYDARRTQFLNAQGFQVIRFWNNEVLDNLAVAVIARTLENMPSPSPSRRREGSLWSPHARSGPAS